MSPILYGENAEEARSSLRLVDRQCGSSDGTAHLTDYCLFRSLSSNVSDLRSKISSLSSKLQAAKTHDLLRSLDSARHSSHYHDYVASIKHTIDQDQDTESSSDDSYSHIEGPSISGTETNTPRKLTKYQSWLVQRCQFHAKWSWLLSEIQSTEFRLKHLRKYSEDAKNLKKRFVCKNDMNVNDSARGKYLKLEKRRRVQTHNLLSPDLIKFVSPLYSNDDNSSDKFVQCRCRLGDTGPCILCCGMKNKSLECNFDFLDEDDILKASLLDNSTHRKLSNISDVRNQIKRNVLFNGYAKSSESHWSYPIFRTSFSPILSTPSQPKINPKFIVNPLSLELAGFSSGNKKFNSDFSRDLFQVTKNETPIDDSNVEKFEIKLPYWRLYQSSNEYQFKNMIVEEDISDDAYVKRHNREEILERRRHYPPMKGSAATVDILWDRVRYFHGYEYKPNNEYGFDLRLFPLPSDDERQLSSSNTFSYQRSKRFKKRFGPF